MTESPGSAPPAPKLIGDEAFIGVDAIVTDFWRYTLSDLRINNTRGYLCEFLVARAVGATISRVEWGAYDVLAPYGARIEVKTSAYLQGWGQQRPSVISFRGLTGKAWVTAEETGIGTRSGEATYNADAYVFCVQTASEHVAYDPLDVGLWDFYVLSREQVAETGQKSISLRPLSRIAGEQISYSELGAKILNV